MQFHSAGLPEHNFCSFLYRVLRSCVLSATPSPLQATSGASTYEGQSLLIPACCIMGIRGKQRQQQTFENKTKDSKCGLEAEGATRCLCFQTCHWCRQLHEKANPESFIVTTPFFTNRCSIPDVPHHEPGFYCGQLASFSGGVSWQPMQPHPVSQPAKGQELPQQELYNL